tara:strand:- start:1107 stop:1442 length:336 start_codon:yes stop_codon:yes gene_type:complete
MTTIEIKKSTNPKKKYMALFIYEEGGKEKKKTIHFGSAPNKDYTIYYKEDGKKKADERKSLYYARHIKREDWTKPMSAGTLSKYILWNKPTLKASIADYIKKFKLKLITSS